MGMEHVPSLLFSIAVPAEILTTVRQITVGPVRSLSR